MDEDRISNDEFSTDSEPTWSNDSSIASESMGCTHRKDRGYAWVVLASSFLCQVVGVGSALSAGAFTPTLVREFNESREAVAWVGSLHAGLLFLGGPLSGVLAAKFGCRTIIIAGSLLASSGVALGACATQLWMLYITYGIMGGTGICFTYIPAVTLLVNYFEQRRCVAFAVSSTGVGVGTLILPQYIEWLIVEYGWRGAYILTAGALLQLTICGLLMTDPPRRAQQVSLKPTSTCLKLYLATILEFRFTLFLLNNYLFNFGSLVLFVFIADYAQVKGMTAQQGIYLISIVGISNGVGRVVNAIISTTRCNKAYVYVFSCTLSGVSVCLINIPVDSNLCFLTTGSFCALYGFLFGVQVGNHAIVTHMLCGNSDLYKAFGITMFMNGLGAITGPPIAGLLYKITGRFEAAFYAAGASIILAGIILIPIVAITRRPKISFVATLNEHAFENVKDSVYDLTKRNETSIYTYYSAYDIRHLSVNNNLAQKSFSCQEISSPMYLDDI